MANVNIKIIVYHIIQHYALIWVIFIMNVLIQLTVIVGVDIFVGKFNIQHNALGHFFCKPVHGVVVVDAILRIVLQYLQPQTHIVLVDHLFVDNLAHTVTMY